MIFSKYEIIVLTNKKKFIVLDIKDFNEDIFYKLKEVSYDEKHILEREIIVIFIEIND